MIHSMTGFAAHRGEQQGFSWAWELRSVNAKGMDLRLRVPDWIEGLETQIRARMKSVVGRGAITLSLRINRLDAEGALSLNGAHLETVLLALAEVEARALDQHLSLAPSTASQILALRGVMEAASADVDQDMLRKQLLQDVDLLLEDFLTMRKSEGGALEGILNDQIAEIERLTTEAHAAAKAREPHMQEALCASLARVMANTDGVDEARLTQELAILAVKADVTEEIDRLRAHVSAARDLVKKGGVIGRKLDFLMQEFNREANTLCSKSQSVDLTGIGLDLKAVIEQMREQVQNVE